MTPNTPDAQERTDQQLEILRELPGIRMDKGEACLCGSDAIDTRTERAFSDSRIYHHSCRACGNEFSTWTEG